jgi:hypothetical protein
MGITAIVAAGAAVAGTAYASNQAKKAAEAANKNLPDPAATAPKADPVTTAKKADGAAAQQQKRSAAAAASASTILTGPGGLGELAPEQGEKKSLLGY